MATWIKDSWEQIPNEALKNTTVAAYFHDGLTFSQLLDIAYFRDESGHSSSDSDSGSSDDADGGDEQDGSTSDGSASDGPEFVHSSGTGSAHSVSEGQVINNDGEVVQEGDCPTTDKDSEMDSDSEVVWAKSARGTWGLGHTFGDKLYFTSQSAMRI